MSAVDELPVRVQGQGPPAIIQGPGWGPASDYLRLTLAPLFGHLQVLTYDVRNTGGAPRRPGPDSQATRELVKDLEGVRLAQRFERPLLFGHSHGAFVAMGYAVLYPTRVRALILITPSIDEPAEQVASREWTQRHGVDRQRAEALRWIRDHPRDSTHLHSDRELARWLRRRMPLTFHDLEAMQRFQTSLIASPAPSIDALRGMPASREPWVVEGLSSIRVPTLVIGGRYDVTTPPAEAARVAALIPDSRLVILERSGHNPWAEEPERFVDHVDAFLSTL